MTAATRVRMAKRTTGAPVFNPLTQVTALHAYWLSDPSWTPPSDGGTITSVRDGAGGTDLISGSATYRASASSMGNRPVAEFNGLSDSLFNNITTINQSFKVVCLHRLMNTTFGGSAGVYGIGGATNRGMSYSSNAGVVRINAGTALLGGAAPDTTGHSHRATFNGASSQIWHDGVSQGSGNAGTNGASRISMGSAIGGGLPAVFAPVQIGFLGFYDGATSDTALAQLASDLRSYYGL